MGALIALLILVPVIILLLQASILSRSTEQRRLLETLYDKIKDLSGEVSLLSKQLKGKEPVIAVSSVLKEPAPADLFPDIKELIKETPVVPAPKPAAIQKPDKPYESKPVTETQFGSATVKEEKLFTSPEITVKEKKDPDIEKYIGENVASKIGIAILVLGISFFVKYAIDKDWVHESGRVIIGLISGCVLLGLAHRYRNIYRSFSSVLMGGGLTVFYFSIAFAFHQYHLIGQTAAFVFMVMVTAFAVFLSLFYNRQELAILATIGGFITPFLVSTGQDNYIALFTYLCILNTGLTALSWFRKWPAINTISLFFTTIIFGGWLMKRMIWSGDENFPPGHALGFATIFYLLFIAMNIINTIRVKGRFASFDFIVLLSVNFLFYTAGMSILSYYNNSNLQGIFTLSLGIFNLMLTAIFYGKKNADRNFVALLTGLTLTFISLTAPVWLKGNYITLFWAAESVILLFLWQRTAKALLKYASLILMALMLGSLAVNWINIYTEPENLLPVIANKGYITSVVVTASLMLYRKILLTEKSETFITTHSPASLRNLLLIIAVTIFYFAGLLETYFQFYTRITAINIHPQFTQLYTFCFAFVLLLLFRNRQAFQHLKIWIALACVVIWFFNYTNSQVVSEALVTGQANAALFMSHWASSALLLWLLVDFAHFLYKKFTDNGMLFTWMACGAMIVVLSIEMYNIIFWSNTISGFDRGWWENLYYKAGLSILWGICSFVLMWLGLKKNCRDWRIISLTLFTITVAKLFIYDIRNIPPGGKIAAFILLGCLLLAVSFMYQRLKRIIMNNAGDDKQHTDDSV